MTTEGNSKLETRSSNQKPPGAGDASSSNFEFRVSSLPRRRFPVCGGVIGAIAAQTLRQCLRRKVLFILGLWLAVILIGLAVIPKHEPAERYHALVSLCLKTTSFFGVIVSVFLAASVLPEDRAKKTLSTLMTKPVGRLNYLLGRVAGFSLTMGLIVLVMGVAGWGVLRWAGASAERETGRTDLVAAKRGLDPTEIIRREGEKTKVVPESRAATVAGGGAQELVFEFREGLESLPEGVQRIEMLPTIATGAEMPQSQATVLIRNPKTGEKQSTDLLLDSDRVAFVDFPPSLVHAAEGVEVVLTCHKPGVFVRFVPGSFQIMTPSAPFEAAYAKALGLILLGLVLVIVVAVTASTFLSAWVAAMLAFTGYFFSLFQTVLVEHMQAISSSEHAGLFGTGIYEHTHGPVAHASDPLYIVAINKLFYGTLWLLTHIFPNFDNFSALGCLTASRDVPWAACGYAAILVAAYAVGYLALAQVVFYKRELMP